MLVTENTTAILPPATIHLETNNLCKHCAKQLCGELEERSGFCCAGCQGVYNFVNLSGLSDFYALRDRDGTWQTNPIKEPGVSFGYLDDVNFQEQFVTKVSDNELSLQCHLDGIHCAACVWLLERTPRLLDGLSSVRVDFARQSARVSFSPDQVKLSSIARLLASLGYSLHPLAPGLENKARQIEDRKFLLRIGIAAFASLNVMLLFVARYQGLLSGINFEYERFFAWISLFLSIPVVAYSATPFYKTAYSGLRLGRVHIDLPLSIAILAAFTASALNTIVGRSEIYFDTLTVLVFLLLCGRALQRQALKKVADISEILYSLTPLHARLVTNSGIKEVFTASLKSNDHVLVATSEVLPVDGTIVAGRSQINASMLTGESQAVDVSPGTEVFAGTQNLGDTITISTKASVHNTRIGQILQQVNTAISSDSRIMKISDRAGTYFIVGVGLLTLLTVLLWHQAGFWITFDRVIALLIVSCPCALGIATPISISLAIADAARAGILIRKGDAIERIASIKKIFLDKTGTLTEGKMCVVKTWSSLSNNSLYPIVLALEQGVLHPLASALCLASPDPSRKGLKLVSKTFVPGCGIQASAEDGNTYRIGALDWLNLDNRQANRLKQFAAIEHTVVGLARNQELIALFALSDKLRPSAQLTIEALRKLGLEVRIISGDAHEVTTQLGSDLGIMAQGNCSPEQKASILRQAGPLTAMVGDGFNDSAALATAGVGIGIRGGADVCMKVADVFFTRPDLTLLKSLIAGARRCMNLIYSNLAISVAYNIAAVILAIKGSIGPLGAALVMPLSSLTVIGISVIAPKFKHEEMGKCQL